LNKSPHRYIEIDESLILEISSLLIVFSSLMKVIVYLFYLS